MSDQRRPPDRPVTGPGGQAAVGATPAPDSPRRYMASRWVRFTGAVVVATSFGAGIRTAQWTWYLAAGLWLLPALDAWLVPGTVVDSHGFRTQHWLRRRTVAWSDVTEVLDVGPGLAPLQMKVRLTTGKLRTLQYVRGEDVPYLRQLLVQSRQAATPTSPPDSPAP